MKHLLTILLLGAGLLCRAEDLEPAVRTSSVPAGPAAAPVTAAPAAPGAPGKAVASRPAAATRPGAGAARPHDQIDLDATQITGNRELPNVMYVVPWKKPDLGDFAGRPPKSLLDEILAPVDRDVFRRQNRYFTALRPDAAVPPPVPAAPASAPADGAAPTLPAGDEK
ncbi:MAG TPA: hypothetical protein VF931_04460 [Steroidobacteraceae bacterium]